MRRPVEVNDLGQGADGTDPLFLGHVRQVCLDGGVGLVGYQDLAVPRRVDAVGAAPVDARRGVRGKHVEVGVTVAVEIGGAQLASSDREVQVGVDFGLEGQLGLVVEPDLAIGDEGQVGAGRRR